MRAVRRVILVFVVLASSLVTAPLRAEWPQEGGGTFEGYWAVSGTLHVLSYKDGRTVTAGGLTGTVTVQTSEGSVPSATTDCVVFGDDKTGGTGRCVWTGISGDKAYVELSSQGQGGFGRVRGTFVGGTGKFEQLTGSFEFEWNYSLSGGSDATLSGQTLMMRGRYKLKGD